jgi:hypothetical protein
VRRGQGRRGVRFLEADKPIRRARNIYNLTWQGIGNAPPLVLRMVGGFERMTQGINKYVGIFPPKGVFVIFGE